MTFVSRHCFEMSILECSSVLNDHGDFEPSKDETNFMNELGLTRNTEIGSQAKCDLHCNGILVENSKLSIQQTFESSCTTAFIDNKEHHCTHLEFEHHKSELERSLHLSESPCQRSSSGVAEEPRNWSCLNASTGDECNSEKINHHEFEGGLIVGRLNFEAGNITLCVQSDCHSSCSKQVNGREHLLDCHCTVATEGTDNLKGSSGSALIPWRCKPEADKKTEVNVCSIEYNHCLSCQNDDAPVIESDEYKNDPIFEHNEPEIMNQNAVIDTIFCSCDVDDIGTVLVSDIIKFMKNMMEVCYHIIHNRK
jgi:hypothetical protein